MMSAHSSLLLLSLLIAAVTVQVHSSCVSLSVQQREKLVDYHNKLRAQVAAGSAAGQPAAADMRVLEWDDRLAASACTWAGQCIAGHDSKEDRQTGIYDWVGQNYAATSRLSPTDEQLEQLIQLWFDEFHDYTYNTKSCAAGKACGHYTQVVWAKTSLVGCAVSHCSSRTALVCNYAPGGNYNGEKAYGVGAAASKCPGHFGFERKGLCLLAEQCQNGKCACHLNAASCANGGTFDAGKCMCQCKTGFYGNKCNNECLNVAQYDAACKSIISSPSSPNCDLYSSICAGSCEACENGKPDPDHQNRDSVKPIID